MIPRKFLKSHLLTLTFLVATSSICQQSAMAQDDSSGMSFGRVKFGQKEDTEWLKVDMRATRASRSRQPVVANVSSPSAFSRVPTSRIGTSSSRLVLASRIAVSNARSHSTSHCWRYVKDALLQASVVDSRPKTEYAKQAGSELEQNFGFIKTGINNPQAAPLGSVLVYGGRGAGHVEIRAQEGFVSDFVSPKPSSRPLIGVYVKR